MLTYEPIVGLHNDNIAMFILHPSQQPILAFKHVNQKNLLSFFNQSTSRQEQIWFLNRTSDKTNVLWITLSLPPAIPKCSKIWKTTYWTRQNHQVAKSSRLLHRMVHSSKKMAWREYAATTLLFLVLNMLVRGLINNSRDKRSFIKTQSADITFYTPPPDTERLYPYLALPTTQYFNPRPLLESEGG